ncbi:MAG TPA: hypothetical protein VHP62_02240, partial [Usitatibacter sp.]|nr:hypothetical protein [Usitatibacter sp.]
MARAQLFHRYRILGLTLAGSAALHAAVMVGTPQRPGIEEKSGVGYSATLDEGSASDPAPVAKPRPPRPHRPHRATTLLAPEPL